MHGRAGTNDVLAMLFACVVDTPQQDKQIHDGEETPQNKQTDWVKSEQLWQIRTI